MGFVGAVKDVVDKQEIVSWRGRCLLVSLVLQASDSRVCDVAYCCPAIFGAIVNEAFVFGVHARPLYLAISWPIQFT